MAQLSNADFLNTTRANVKKGVTIPATDGERIGEIIKNTNNVNEFLDSVETLILVGGAAVQKEELTEDDQKNLQTTVRRLGKVASKGPINIRLKKFNEQETRARANEMINNGFDLVEKVVSQHPEVMTNYLFGLTTRAVTRQPFSGFNVDEHKITAVKTALENIYA